MPPSLKESLGDLFLRLTKRGMRETQAIQFKLRGAKLAVNSSPHRIASPTSLNVMDRIGKDMFSCSFLGAFTVTRCNKQRILLERIVCLGCSVFRSLSGSDFYLVFWPRTGISCLYSKICLIMQSGLALFVLARISCGFSKPSLVSGPERNL